ncbi:MAG: DNA polymerase III subunit delta [Spirochaetes bacterium GWD1_61_31]|nr:MAG: DNA polymerase III subunit delta [Spirochaetes bacterium GWB1_60_80]OHD31300.1 MAG: DNA polymerase III subunit delta [Spirochaetes bacterium GWC1_61_12]OHD39486.1 MAG: DNA polymerase III subunit delta [Spirochaetes bacterium GWD1_61_31]OHD45538.1 MAG: DNA polymerase III subunit delta [Spirochaetes bacterium GWE1_60_18]OHD58111.1 MAG: DNA polymerase III subunit delta [Spirochaetes bacterium GWF1_60_12]HAP44683.1 DNA polymerase III subunit delta [Spirochaetaceae bacterium]
MLSVHLLGGPETGRRNDFIAQLRKQCLQAWREEPENHKLYAQDCGVSQLLDLLMNGSLFAVGKFVVYMGAEQIKGKADVQALLGYIRKPAANTVLVLVSETYGIDKTLEDALPKEARKIFWELSSGEMERWVGDYFAGKGIHIDAEALELILELVENNTDALRLECSRLALFFPHGARIGEDDIERYIAHNRSEDAFSLFDRMATGNLEQALETWSAILASREGNGVSLMAGLLWSLRRLASLHEAMANGNPFEQAARSLRITSRKLLSVYDSARRRWPEKLCRQLLAFGVETDIQLRALGSGQERILVELFLYGCLHAKRPVALTVPAALY